MELYLSDKREELEKEKKKRDAVRTLMPQSFEGIEDSASYYLADDKWENYQRLSDGIFAEPNKKEEATKAVPNKELILNPWNSGQYAGTPEYIENLEK